MRPKGLPKSGGRQKGTPNHATVATRKKSKEYFERILDDKRETLLWNRFIDLASQDSINFQAFRLAVQYKRGMPVQPQELKSDGQSGVIVWNIPAGAAANGE